MNRDILEVGQLTVSEFGDFLSEKGWKCSHCDNTEYLIEEFAQTRRCAVSSMPYVAASDKGEFYITGSGAPSYTILCSNCFAVTKYNALRVIRTVRGEQDND